MSTIVGVVRTDGQPADREWLRRAAALPAWGAPDGVNVWNQGSVGLGYGMLATGIPGEGEHPLTLDHTVWITADVRLDDRLALAAELRSHGRDVPADTGDGGLILHAYAVWGVACVEHLSGDFAFALWDERQQRLLLACDPLGVIPLYYVRTRDGMTVANSIASVRACPDVSDAIETAAVVDYLLCGYAMDLDVTFYRDIRRLPPAHVLTWTPGGEPQMRRYWEIPPFDGYLRLRTAADYVARFRDLLRAAVRDRLPPDRAAFTLTGGLDSGSVVALAADICREEGRTTTLHAYSIGHDWMIPDQECYHAFLTADACGVPSEYLSVERLLFGEREGIGWRLVPEPRLAVSRPSNFVEMCQRASAVGTRVVLSGLGGDALLEPVRVQWGDLARAGQLWPGLRGVAQYVSEYGRVSPGVLRRLLVSPRSARGGHRPVLDLLASELAGGSVVRDRCHRLDERRRHWRVGAERLTYDAFWATAMSIGEPEFTEAPVRMRHPFLDTRLLAFAVQVPPMPWFVDKLLLREATRALLPESIRRRRKTFLSASPLVALTKRGLHRGADSLLNSPGIDKFVDRALVGRCLEEIQSHPSTNALLGVERALAVCHWLDPRSECCHLVSPERETATHVA